MPRNPLRSPAEALRFVVDFVQTDIRRVGQRHREAAETCVRQLIALTMERLDDHDFAGEGWYSERPVPRAALERLHADGGAFLRSVVASGHAEPVVLNLRFSVARATVRRKRRMSDTFTVRHPTAWILADGSPRDRFLYRVIRLLEDVGFDKVQVCKRPDCERLFFKVTRKEFCSPRCQSCQYMRDLRRQERVERQRRIRRRRSEDEAKARSG
jgi:hypothetical protein